MFLDKNFNNKTNNLKKMKKKNPKLKLSLPQKKFRNFKTHNSNFHLMVHLIKFTKIN